jgi:DNA-binding winged helix-turn-helix (wHTH) protein/tetratricopeptide (TPR) repeat protein
MASSAPLSSRIRFGPFDLNAASGELRKSGTPIKLRLQAIELLFMLAERAGHVVTRQEIRQRLWTTDTFVDFERSINFCINQIRGALGDDAEKPRYVETLPRRGYRFITPVTMETGREPAPVVTTAHQADAERAVKRYSWPIWIRPAIAAGAMALVAGLAVVAWRLHVRKAHTLSATDTVVLADFSNETNDSVFDHTLRQGLSVQLEQSPFLSIVSDHQTHQTLHLMGQKSETKLTTEVARELCQRAGSAAVISGSIAQIGARYSLVLKATNCASGELIASSEAEAADKDHVLAALATATSQIRTKLGESLSSVEKLSTPLEQATTPSLEALQAYTLALKQTERGAPGDAIPFLNRAVELDPNFALAYAGLAIVYANKDKDLSAKYAMKAFDLRSNVSERERLHISAVYYQTVTGELDKEIETLKFMEQTYPRNAWAHGHLGSAYQRAGELDRAVEEYRAAISLDSKRPWCRYNLGSTLLLLGNFNEAKSVLEETIAKKIDNMDVHIDLYRIAYFQNDTVGMKRELDWASGKPDEFRMRQEQGELDMREGRLETAGELLRRANDLAARQHLDRKIPFGITRLAGLRALFGDCHGLPEQVSSERQASSPTAPTPLRMAVPLALCGYTRQADELIQEARVRSPQDTDIQAVLIPAARAAIAIHDGDPEGAIQLLRSAAPYENVENAKLAHATCFYPGVMYLRGLAYLQAQKAPEAANEFQRVINQGPVQSIWFYPLAHLGLARAFALQGDHAKAKAAYQDFLTLWKDADPDIPILKQAKLEYAKLQ